MKPVFQLRTNALYQSGFLRRLLFASLFLLFSIQVFSQTATITGDITICQGSSAPLVTFTGADGIPEYIFTYTINGGAPQTVSTTGGSSIVTIPAPTGTAGTFVYALVDVTDGTPNTQNATGSITIIVNPLPAAITGTFNVCTGSSVTLGSTTSGGTWSSGTLAVATVIVDGGVVTGVLAGTSIITYTLGTGCFVNQTITVKPIPTTSAIYHH